MNVPCVPRTQETRKFFVDVAGQETLRADFTGHETLRADLMDNKILRAAFLIYGHLFTGYGFWRSKTLRAFKNVTHEPA